MDENDRLICKPGDLISSNYRVISMIGEGTFSNVYLCADLKSNSEIVVKACRSRRSYVAAAEDEIKTIKHLNSLDKNQEFFVRFHSSFNYKRHICIVLEKLGPSLYAALKFNSFHPFYISAVKSMMKQIVGAVDILHKNQIVHTDLKLENILLKGGMINKKGNDIENDTEEHALVRLIDFSSIDTGDAWHHHLITTRHYRAPEVLMGLRWGYESDIWSLGCILVELATGKIEFDAYDPIDHLYLIQQMIGYIPVWMWRNSTNRDIGAFARDGYISSRYVSRRLYEETRRKPELGQILNQYSSSLSDLAGLMLNPDPYKRPKTKSILNHKFFNDC